MVGGYDLVWQMFQHFYCVWEVYFFCHETLNNLVEKEKLGEAIRVLEKIIGRKNVEVE